MDKEDMVARVVMEAKVAENQTEEAEEDTEAKVDTEEVIEVVLQEARVKEAKAVIKVVIKVDTKKVVEIIKTRNNLISTIL
jgi:hypothetical protein